jgi:hypothetical protein
LVFGVALLLGATACLPQFLRPTIPTKLVSETVIATSTVVPTATATPTNTVTPTAAATYTPVTPQPPLFGVGMDHITSLYGLDQMSAAFMTWTRPVGVLWSSVEPSQGTYDWNVLADLETELKNASSNGIQVILLVHSTPEWARKIAGTGPSCGPIAADKLSAFGDFMHAMVARYSVAPYNVKYWELWNEPDIAATLFPGDSGYGCWGDTGDGYYGGGYYAEMLKVVYPQIKAANSQTQVLIGGLLLDCDPRGGCATPESALPPKFFEGVLRNNGGDYFDGVSFHAYDYYLYLLGEYYNPNWTSAWNTTGPVIFAKAQFIQSLLSQYGVTGKFLMNTEAAVICGHTGGEPVCQADDFSRTKVYYVAQSYAMAIAQGLRANIWYSVQGWRGSGFLDASLNPLPAYTAFQIGRNELRDAAYSGEIVPADLGGIFGIKGYKFQLDDRTIWVLWSLDGGTHLITLARVPLAARDALGVSVTPAAFMNVTLNPLYLEWNP